MAAGFALRAAWGVLIPVSPVSDPAAYLGYAVNIVEHGVYGLDHRYPSAFWPPGTAAMIATMWKLFGDPYGPMVVLNVVLSTGLIFATYLVGRQFLSPAAAIFGATLIAFWPSGIMFVTVLSSETPFLFLATAGIAALGAKWRRPIVGGIVAGLLLAGASYVRPVALLLPVVMLVLVVWRDRTRLFPMLTAFCATVLVMAVLIAPWTMRNAEFVGHPFLISSNFGHVFWSGNHPGALGFHVAGPQAYYEGGEHEAHERFLSEALAHIAAEPEAFVIRTLRKFLLLHVGETIGVWWNLNPLQNAGGDALVISLKIIASCYWYAVLSLAMMGILAVFFVEKLTMAVAQPPLIVWLYYSSINALTQISDRYHFPSMPFLCLLAGVALAALAVRIHRQRSSLAVERG